MVRTVRCRIYLAAPEEAFQVSVAWLFVAVAVKFAGVEGAAGVETNGVAVACTEFELVPVGLDD